MADCSCSCSARMEAMERRLAALEVSRPDRDRGAADLRFALAVIAPDADGLTFDVSDVIERAKTDAALRRAMEAATVETAGEIGCWLRQHQGVRDGIVISRRGRRWHICTSSTYVQSS